MILMFSLKKVGKEFDALLVDTAAVAGTGQLPVFDVFPCDSFEVFSIHTFLT